MTNHTNDRDGHKKQTHGSTHTNGSHTDSVRRENESRSNDNSDDRDSE